MYKLDPRLDPACPPDPEEATTTTKIFTASGAQMLVKRLSTRKTSLQPFFVPPNFQTTLREKEKQPRSRSNLILLTLTQAFSDTPTTELEFKDTRTLSDFSSLEALNHLTHFTITHGVVSVQ